MRSKKACCITSSLCFVWSSVSRTNVIDDEMDYFSMDSNRWMTQKEREKLRAKEDELRRQKHGSRRNQAITLDFAGRKVIEEKSVVGLSNSPVSCV